MTTSVFAAYETKNYPYRYAADLLVGCLAGGTPADPKIAEGWLKTKLADKDDLIREAIAEAMVERELDADAATEYVDANKHLVGFKRDTEHGLFIEGRQVKSMLKEAANIAASSGKIKHRGWGKFSKGVLGWVAEHVFVPERRIYLGCAEPSGIAQSFPKSRHGSSIQYTEYVEDAKVRFTIVTDHRFTDDEWAAIWLAAQYNGLGAGRTQGYGTFTVTGWTDDPPT